MGCWGVLSGGREGMARARMWMIGYSVEVIAMDKLHHELSIVERDEI